MTNKEESIVHRICQERGIHVIEINKAIDRFGFYVRDGTGYTHFISYEEYRERENMIDMLNYNQPETRRIDDYRRHKIHEMQRMMGVDYGTSTSDSTTMTASSIGGGKIDPNSIYRAMDSLPKQQQDKCKCCGERHEPEKLDILGRCKNKRDNLYKSFSVLFWERKIAK